jgi:maltooligosyltrehalose trehalohydrolase
MISPKDEFGLGFDTQWADDFHHSLHTLLTGEQDGYYEGFPPKVSNLARVLTTGYLYIGQHSTYRRRKYGLKPKTRNGAQFVISSQNHDQVGNRMTGERLPSIVSLEKVRQAAAAIILSPFIPMLFMGEEYGETAPFQYFTSHSDPDLIEAVRKGRREEFDDFTWEGEPPDPHDEQTFQRSKLSWNLDSSLRRLYKQLLAFRRDIPSLRSLDLDKVETHADDERRVLLITRAESRVAFNFSDVAQTLLSALPALAQTGVSALRWEPLIDTGAKIAGDQVTLPPHSFALWIAGS